MSKRHGATAVPDYREMGYLPQTLINYLALLSWSPPAEKEVLDKDELLRLFDIGDLSPSPAVFDKAKLDWLNSKHLHMAPLSELVRAAGRFAPEWSDNPHFPLMVESVLDNLVTLSDLPRYLAPFGPAEVPTEQVAHWVRSESGRAVVEKAIDILENRDLGGLEDAKQIIAEIKRDFMEKGLKAREVLMPVRVALTGKDKGPPLPYLLVVLGLEESISRLREL